MTQTLDGTVPVLGSLWKLVFRCRIIQRLWKKTFEKIGKNVMSKIYSENMNIVGNRWFWEDFGIGHIAKNMKFGTKTHSKGSSNLSVGAQTLWSCSTHQFYNFWKFHQKILIFSEVINDFRFRHQSYLFACSRAEVKADFERNRKSSITSLKINIFWWNFQKL